tara:strand:- start:712 stop:1587 length:876 start_codon:yes stop_codon:yes gene_type:complete
MKTSYFSTDRGGRLHYLYSALINGESALRLKGDIGLYGTIFNPKNNTRQWYWVDNDNNIRHVSENRRYDDIDWIGTLKDSKIRKKHINSSEHFMAREVNRSRPKELEDNIIWQPHKLHEIFDKFFECDHILHPDVLLGYHGYSKPTREGLNMSDALLKDERYLEVDLDYSIDQMKKRKNIIVYKDDIRHMARSWFLGGGWMSDMSDEMYYNNITCRINEARKYPTCMQIALERYDIPYEMWSLDKGDYSVFGFNNDLKRYETDGTDILLKSQHHDKIDEWIDRYVSENHEV